MGPKVWFLIAIALLVPWHIGWIVTNPQYTRPPLPIGDGPDYETIAYSLHRGEGFQFAWQDPQWQEPYLRDPDVSQYTQLARSDWPGPTASRPPLYPALISLVYCLIPRGPSAFATIRLLSAMFTALAGAFSVAIAVSITARITPKKSLSSIAAVLTIFLALMDRTIRTYSIDFLTEPLALCLTTLLVATGLALIDADSKTRIWRHILLLSLLTALLVLTRSLVIFWVPGLVAMVWFSARPRHWKRGLFFLLGFLVLVAPWWVRNSAVLDRWMPLGGQGAASLRGGYSDEALADHGNWHSDAEDRIQKALSEDPNSKGWSAAQREVALADRASRETRDWIQNHLAEMPRLLAMRIATHWGPYFGPSLLWRIGILAGFITLLLHRRRESIWLIGIPLVNTLTILCLYEAGGRFLVPLYGVLYAVAAIGFSSGIGAIADRLRSLYRK